MEFVPGSISVSTQLFFADDAGLPLLAKVAADFPTVMYQKAGANLPVTIALVDLAQIDSAWSSGGVKEIGAGYYRLDLPNDAVADDLNVIVFGEASGKHVLVEQMDPEPPAVSITNNGGSTPDGLEPLFCASFDELKQRLRLSAAYTADSTSLINEAIQTARIRFYESLGAARIAEIVAITPVTAPTTSDELLQSKAVLCESKLVRALLMRTMPQLFIDGSSVSREVWNQEGFTRQNRDVLQQFEMLMAEVDAMLSDLAGTSSELESSSLNVYVNQPDYTPSIGETIGIVPGA